MKILFDLINHFVYENYIILMLLGRRRNFACIDVNELRFAEIPSELTHMRTGDETI